MNYVMLVRDIQTVSLYMFLYTQRRSREPKKAITNNQVNKDKKK